MHHFDKKEINRLITDLATFGSDLFRSLKSYKKECDISHHYVIYKYIWFMKPVFVCVCVCSNEFVCKY